VPRDQKSNGLQKLRVSYFQKIDANNIKGTEGLARCLSAYVKFAILSPPPSRARSRAWTAVPASASIGEHVARHRDETESVVEFPIGQQTGIRGDPRTMELKLQAAVEIEPENGVIRFTRRVQHVNLARSNLTSSLS
jgi:hypothetical protein